MILICECPAIGWLLPQNHLPRPGSVPSLWPWPSIRPEQCGPSAGPLPLGSLCAAEKAPGRRRHRVRTWQGQRKIQIFCPDRRSISCQLNKDKAPSPRRRLWTIICFVANPPETFNFAGKDSKYTYNLCCRYLDTNQKKQAVGVNRRPVFYSKAILILLSSASYAFTNISKLV